MVRYGRNRRRGDRKPRRISDAGEEKDTFGRAVAGPWLLSPAQPCRRFAGIRASVVRCAVSVVRCALPVVPCAARRMYTSSHTQLHNCPPDLLQRCTVVQLHIIVHKR